jgi:addiction module RelE/StbE family toxin
MVVWTATALANLRVIRTYIEQFNPRAASDLAAELNATCANLVRFPHRGGLVPGTDMRELRTAPPYVIRYRVLDDSVVITRVRQMSRRHTRP